MIIPVLFFFKIAITKKPRKEKPKNRGGIK